MAAYICVCLFVNPLLAGTGGVEGDRQHQICTQSGSLCSGLTGRAAPSGRTCQLDPCALHLPRLCPQLQEDKRSNTPLFAAAVVLFLGLPMATVLIALSSGYLDTLSRR